MADINDLIEMINDIANSFGGLFGGLDTWDFEIEKFKLEVVSTLKVVEKKKAAYKKAPRGVKDGIR